MEFEQEEEDEDREAEEARDIWNHNHRRVQALKKLKQEYQNQREELLKTMQLNFYMCMCIRLCRSTRL